MRIFYFSILLVSFALSAYSAERGKQWYGSIPSAPGDEQFQRIYVQNGTLFHEDGSEVALWGVNFQSAMSWEWRRSRRDNRGRAYDSSEWKSIVERSFDEIQQMGCKVIRIHLSPADYADAEGNLLKNDWLDMLDYTMAECHRRGIYINLALLNHMGGDRKTDAIMGGSMKKNKLAAMVVPQKIQATENYIRQLVNRKNPYDKGRVYKEYPGWIIAEIINEPSYPKSKPSKEEFPDSVRVYEAWLLANAKTDGLDAWGTFKKESIKAYINRMDQLLYDERVPAISSWNLYWSQGAKHQGWEPFDAAAESSIPVVSFSTYPGQGDSGKGGQKDLSGKNYLPYLKQSYAERDWQGWLQEDRFKGKKAAIVYEFEAWHNLSAYIHPAMAKYFRAQGAQVATMWTYYLNEAGSENSRTHAHNLNLVTTPQKAASFMVAGKIFEETPRYIPFEMTEEDADRFGNVAFSYPMDLSAYATDDLLIHADDLGDDFIELPRIPKQIVGYGSSPFIQYAGKGLYFLEAVFEDGRFAQRWTLRLQPNVVFGEDDYPIINVEKEFSFTLRLPAFDFRNWEVRSIKSGRGVPANATSQSISFDAAPGDYEIVYESFK
jgi:hypothetical protein